MRLNRYHSASADFTAHIASLRAAIVTLALICLGMTYVLYLQTREIRLSLPPVLEYGARLKAGEIQPYEVYSVVGYVYQALHTWLDDGREDFRNNIQNLRFFFTPQGNDHLKQKFKSTDENNQLTKRIRYYVPADFYKPELVKTHSKESWTVTLRYYLVEDLEGVRIKDRVLFEVQLPVHYQNSAPEFNPWGLWIGKPVAGPERI